MKEVNLTKLNTEARNSNSANLDTLSSKEILTIINQEDAMISTAINQVLDSINQAVSLIIEAIQNGGKVFYLGAGSSGRIGVLDASEMKPTYGVDNLFVGLIAGGDFALRNPIEGAEDNPELGKFDLKEHGFQPNDVLVVIGASGRTPYCLGALNYAKSMHAKTISLSMTKGSQFAQLSDVNIEVITGPEVITGSTRMKAGTATKMVLNMISTTVMVKLNKVYDNLMVDVQPTNDKLVQRAFNIIKTISHAADREIWAALKQTSNEVKPAIIMLVKHVSFEQAIVLLNDEPSLRMILESN